MVKKRCYIISAAPTCKKDIELLRSMAKSENDFVIAADAGYETAIEAGINVDLFVGDCDSSKHSTDTIKCEKIILPKEKDDTDTLFCAKEAVKRGFEEVYILCALAGRYDHMLANLSVLLYLEKNKIKASAQDSTCKLWIKQQSSTINIKYNVDSFVSIFPFACHSCTVSGTGLKYPINNTLLFSHLNKGISNEVIKNHATIHVNDGCACIILNKV